MTINKQSIILNTDSYKASMYLQYPPNTTGVYSYIESRGGAFDSTVFFGLQSFIKNYLLTPITAEDIDYAESIIVPHSGYFNRAGWEYILKEHNGFLPLKISAPQEGLVIPTRNVLVTVENTDPKCAWITTYAETALLRAIWYPTTVATVSKSIKNVIAHFLEKTGDISGLPYKLHDFGPRGCSSYESATIGGTGHLVNFVGTDNFGAVVCAISDYSAVHPGASIPAAEHSTITAWGRPNEVDAYRNMITQFGFPSSIFAVVSDSYDIFNAAEKLWGDELYQQVVDSGATVVIRPDSGDPVAVNMKLISILGSKFGYTVNSKGFKVLNNVRIIQGDGVNELAIRSILGALMSLGWSADNIAFGMGGGLLGAPQRDDLKFAMKASAVCVDGIWIPIQKDPITDQGKKSKTGRVVLYRSGDQFTSGVERIEPLDWSDTSTKWSPALEVVYENGRLLRDMTFDEVRANSNL